MNRNTIIAVLLLALVAGLYLFMRTQPGDEDAARQAPAAGAPIVTAALPASLSDRARIGATIFAAKCVDCHGEAAVGRQGAGPPLIHKIYEPSHHADESFQRAVAFGVRQHHWPFGDMAPVEGLTRADVTMIVAYIREVQRTNGIN